jgi:hypothetical protein
VVYNAWVDDCNKNRADKPSNKDFSKELQSAAKDAAGADAKNNQTLKLLNQQHEQSTQASIAKYRADVRTWCSANTSDCSAKCAAKSRGAVAYLSACNNVCSAAIDACVAKDLNDPARQTAAADRLTAADANMRRVVDQLNDDLRRRAQEQMEAALEVQSFLSNFSAAFVSTYSGSGHSASAPRMPPAPPPPPPPPMPTPAAQGGGHGCSYQQGCEASR